MNKESENRLTPPAVKQRITVSGRNWNEYVKLPCFRSLNYDEKQYFLLLKVDWYNGAPANMIHLRVAYIGDTLVEYVDGTWGVERKGAKP